MQHPDGYNRVTEAAREFLTIIGVDPADVTEIEKPEGPGLWRIVHRDGTEQWHRGMSALTPDERLRIYQIECPHEHLEDHPADATDTAPRRFRRRVQVCRDCRRVVHYEDYPGVGAELRRHWARV